MGSARSQGVHIFPFAANVKLFLKVVSVYISSSTVYSYRSTSRPNTDYSFVCSLCFVKMEEIYIFLPFLIMKVNITI